LTASVGIDPRRGGLLDRMARRHSARFIYRAPISAAPDRQIWRVAKWNLRRSSRGALTWSYGACEFDRASCGDQGQVEVPLDGGIVGQAAGMFAITNIDDILILSIFFGQAKGRSNVEARVVVGQYIGFGAILLVSVVGALGTNLLPEGTVAYLGLVPLLLGVRAAVAVRRGGEGSDEPAANEPVGPTARLVAAVTFANGGDNIGVYIPVFAAAGGDGIVIYGVVFLVMVAVWCVAARFLATRPPIARALDRWGHVLLPVVLITIGVLLLVQGGAFGL
jgi:cadmium resistance protein CadD (predicted permease)